mmetsp:Transcript_107361/g.309071  ORF Transcript_107361/g.309071 Transcript_107361/m.309071 type:complete len:830 (+) Transcript_107361:192-2681(+)
MAAAATEEPRARNVNFAKNARLNAVREACSIPPESRSEDDVSNILHFASDVKFLQKLAETEVRPLCRAMTLEVFAAKDVVFKVGDEGDKFYIILTGSVSVLIPPAKECPNDIHPQGSCTCPQRGEDTVIALDKGQGFGELALQSSGSTRSATVVTNEATELLIVTQKDFDVHAGKLHRMYISQRVRFLRRFPKIEDALQRSVVNAKDIAAIANCLQERSLSGGELLARQGDPVEGMTFVRSGQLAMLRLVDPDDLREADGSQRATRPSTSASLAAALGPKEEERWGQKAALQATLQLATNLSKAMQAERRGPGEKRPWWASPKVVKHVLGGGKTPMTQTNSGVGMVAVTSFVERKLRRSPGQVIWTRLRTAFGQARVLRTFSVGGAEQAANLEQEEDSGKRHVQQMLDVSAARRKVAEYRSKELTSHERHIKRKKRSSENKNGSGPFVSEGVEHASVSSGKTKHGPPSKKVLFRIGTICAYQYFGDRQVSHSEPYPVSLVGDPVAEVFTMSKYDIQRRFPKKLFSELFCPDRQSVPSDAQTLQLKRQNERWADFRKNLYQPQTAFVGRPLTFGAPTSRPRDRAALFGDQEPSAKFEVLGLHMADDVVVESLEPRGIGASASLTPLDEIFYSQSPAAFLRKFQAMQRDPELRTALMKAGIRDLRHGPKSSSPTGSAKAPSGRATSKESGRAASKDGAPKRSGADPNAFHFDLRWAEVENLSVGTDLKHNDDLWEQVLAKRMQNTQTDAAYTSAEEEVRNSVSPDPPRQPLARRPGSGLVAAMGDHTAMVGALDLPPITPRSFGRSVSRGGGAATPVMSARTSGRKVRSPT